MYFRLLLCPPGSELDRTVRVTVDERRRPTVAGLAAVLGWPGDRIAIDGRSAAPASPLLDTLVDGATITSRACDHTAAPSVLRISVVAGPDGGRVLPLVDGAQTVGRHPSSAVVIDDRTISRRHLELHVSG